jgi:hypothetical protein
MYYSVTIVAVDKHKNQASCVCVCILALVIRHTNFIFSMLNHPMMCGLSGCTKVFHNLP